MWKGTLLKLILRKVSKTWFIFPFQLFCAQAIDNENESQAENAIEMEMLADSYAVCENWNMYQILKKIWNNKMQSANLNHEST